jgi:serine protease Do
MVRRFLLSSLGLALCFPALADTTPIATNSPTPLAPITIAVPGLPRPVTNLPPSVTKALPESIEELKTFQKQTREVLQKVIPATVGLRVGNAAGSGVIISKDGYILTAGHVSSDPDIKIQVILPDGKIVDGITLGVNPNRRVDAGMAKITTPGEYPFVEMGVSKDLKPGQWVVATGHPGGYKKGRSPVVRVGRIGAVENFIQTDCTLVGGDSGGPLFDMAGRVIAIHSQIGLPIFANLHVPVDVYRESWDPLVKSEVIGAVPYLGVGETNDAPNCKISFVTAASPADKAGIKAGDIVIKFGGKQVANYNELVTSLKTKKPRESVPVLVQRGDEYHEVQVKLGWRSN